MTNESDNDCGVQIALMIEQGDNLFDEVRFHYITSIYERASKHRQSVASMLKSKVQSLLTRYQQDLASVEEQSSVLGHRIKLSFPESANDVDQCERYYDVSALAKLEDRLIRTNREGMLTMLTQLLLQENNSNENKGEPSFLELLQSQEIEALDKFTSTQRPIDSKRSELKSVRMFRESQERRSSDQLVKQAIKEGPDNPGPINPHMLAIRSLSSMQSLSPQYLKRFISYIDTVFWLEQAGDQLKPKSKPKTTNKQAIKTKSK